MNWFDILNRYNDEVLSAMCTVQRIEGFTGPVTSSNRITAIAELGKVLGRPAAVEYAQNFMGEAELAALKIIIRIGGQADTDMVFKRLLAEGAPIRANRRIDIAGGEEAQADYQGEPYFEDVMARAACFGLIFSRESYRGGSASQIGFTPGRVAFVPESVQQTLAARSDFGERPNTAKPALIASVSASDFQRDLSRYWRHVRKQGELGLTTQGWIYKTNFKTFVAALNLPADAPLDEASNGRLWFIRRMLVALGEIEGGFYESFHSVPEASKLLSLPMAERIKRCYDTWRFSGAWNELIRLPVEHQGLDHRREAPAELGPARELVLRMIARLSAGHRAEWVGIDSLIGQMRRNHYDFLFPRARKSRAFSGVFGTPYSGSNNAYNVTFPGIRDEGAGWNLVEQAYIVNALTGPLYWQGLVELGYSKDDAPGENVMPAAYRLTSAGAWLLGIGEEPTFIESGGRVLVQPNFTVLAMEPISDAVLIDLDQFADSQGGDRAVSYALTRESLYRGQQRGWPAERAAAFLEQHQGSPLPANVRRTMDEWESQHRRITFRRKAQVVQFADDDARDEVLLALQGLGSRALGDRFAILDSPYANATAVISTLRDSGWAPLVEEAEEAAHAAVLRIDASGLIQFSQPTPSVRVLGTLSQVASVNGNNVWRLDAARIRASAEQGLTADQLLAQIAELHLGPVPIEIEHAVRRAAGFFGEAELRNVSLLEVASVEVLTNLVNDPEVGAYLEVIEGSSRPMAIIDAAQAHRVRALLIDRGVTFK